jgi:hypothetical protein
MKHGTDPFDEPRPVKSMTRPKYICVEQPFFDKWARILTPAEMITFLCIERFCDFSTHESDGRFSYSTCQEMTCLNRKTIVRAISKLTEYKLLVSVKRNGKAGLIWTNQQVDPPMSARRRGRNWAQNTSRPDPAAGLGPVPAAGLGPVPAAGLGADPAAGLGPDPAAGPSADPAAAPLLYTRYPLTPLAPPKDDDDSMSTDLGILAEEFQGLGMTVDMAMATRMLRAMRQARPDITAGEIIAVVKDRLPIVMRTRNVRTPMAYLLRAILEIAVSPTFDRIRKHHQATVVDPQEQSRREAIAQQDRIEAWTLQARRGERWAQKACQDAGIDWQPGA